MKCQTSTKDFRTGRESQCEEDVSPEPRMLEGAINLCKEHEKVLSLIQKDHLRYIRDWDILKMWESV